MSLGDKVEDSLNCVAGLTQEYATGEIESTVRHFAPYTPDVEQLTKRQNSAVASDSCAYGTIGYVPPRCCILTILGLVDTPHA
jgi:hypothetical protein